MTPCNSWTRSASTSSESRRGPTPARCDAQQRRNTEYDVGPTRPLKIADPVRDDMFTILFQKNGNRYVVVSLPRTKPGSPNSSPPGNSSTRPVIELRLRWREDGLFWVVRVLPWRVGLCPPRRHELGAAVAARGKLGVNCCERLCTDTARGSGPEAAAFPPPAPA